MNIRLGFFGAAQNVTGSCYLLTANGRKILVDCGIFQERKFVHRNWDEFPFSPADVDVVLLTHAHLDHCGRLPKLVKEGYRGEIICTPATAELADIILKDSAKIQEEDAKFKRRRHQRENRTGPHPIAPLYTQQDVEETCKLFRLFDYDQSIDLGNGIHATFCDAGHILGSAMIRMTIRQDDFERVLIFSGDIGRKDALIVNDPTRFQEADYVVMESTYGDRDTGAPSNLSAELARIITETVDAGGNILIPSFAVERTQELLYRLNELQHAHKIPHLLTFIDSPMAIRVTEVFQKHPELFDVDTVKILDQGRNPYHFTGLKTCMSADESKAINHINGSVIIIAGSGMCTGGRIKHHLVNNINRPESTVLFVGYQAVGTLGRQIVDGEETVRILGNIYPVKARIERVEGFSGHADKTELFEWISAFKKKAPGKVFLTHGEAEASKCLAGRIKNELGFDAVVPAYKETFKIG